MKKILLICIVFLPLVGFCDTLDYWSVYVNDSLIGEFTTESKDNEFEINYHEIKESDTLTIIYGNDHPCVKCEYYYLLKEMYTGHKTHVERRNEILQKVSFPLVKLRKYEPLREFAIYVSEINYTVNKNSHTQLIRLNLLIN